MEDKELYQHILGLKSPWSVSDVKLDTASQQIDIHIEHPSGTKFCCPDCDESLPCYDHAPERQWRHLDRFLPATRWIGSAGGNRL